MAGGSGSISKVECQKETQRIKILDDRVCFGNIQFKVKWLPQNKYTLQEIIGERETSNGLEFQVKWKGDTVTWESEENISDCKEAIRDFILKKYSNFIDDATIIDDSPLNKDHEKGEWVSSSKLSCYFEIKEYYSKRTSKCVVHSIVGPVKMLNDEVIFLVKYKTGDYEGHDSVPASILKDRFPEMFLKYLEEHMQFSIQDLLENCTVKRTVKGKVQETDLKKTESDDEDDVDYIVKEVHDKKVNKWGEVYYKLEWEDLKDAAGNVIKKYKKSWEPAENVDTCPLLVYKFEIKRCKGLQSGFQLNKIIDIKKNLNEQIYAEVEWKNATGSVFEKEFVFYEVIRREFTDHVIDYLLGTVVQHSIEESIKES